MTQKENIQEAIKHLDDAIDRFPDKDDEIREYNDFLETVICKLENLIK